MSDYNFKNNVSLKLRKLHMKVRTLSTFKFKK